MKGAGERGVTLVELMVTIFIGAVILLAASTVVVQANIWLKKGQSRLALQRDFSLITRVLAENIRDSEYGQQKIYTSLSAYANGSLSQSEGACLQLFFPSGDSLLLYLEDNSFVLLAGADTTKLVQDNVQTVLFTDQGRYVQTAVILKKDNWTLADTLYDAFRNY